MDEKNTIEVLLFKDLATIHRQDWAALQKSRLYARLTPVRDKPRPSGRGRIARRRSRPLGYD